MRQGDGLVDDLLTIGNQLLSVAVRKGLEVNLF